MGLDGNMQKTKYKAMVLLCVSIAACDQTSDELSWRDEEQELTLDEDEKGAIEHERIEEAIAQQTWDDALEELLDLECDGLHRCSWVWTDLEALGLDDLIDELPEPPAARVELEPTKDVVTEADPPEVFTKQIRLNAIYCNNRQEIRSDEPYLLLNGAQVWSATGVSQGESRNIFQTHGFNNRVFLELREADRGRDDFMGRVEVTAEQNGEHFYVFRRAGGRYTLYYSVSDWGG